MLFAGHETTSNTVGLILLEMARNPSVQIRLRREIYDMEKVVRARGDTEFSAIDLEAMPLVQAIIKETLRMHPVAPHSFRWSLQDDVLPLAKPIVTKSGKTLTAVPIAKGTRILMSIAAYNRFVLLKTLFLSNTYNTGAVILTFGDPILTPSIPIAGSMGP